MPMSSSNQLKKIFLLYYILNSLSISSKRPPFSTDKLIQNNYFATTVTGLEPVLKNELLNCNIGATGVVEGKCGVYFKGNMTTVLSSIMWSRTALRVMEKIVEGDSIEHRDDLYSLVSSVDWSAFIGNGATIKVDTTIGSTVKDLSHTHFTSLTVKNAIVDQFMDRYGSRPNVDTVDPDVSFLLYIHRGKATLYRIWSGEFSMHKRGYRQEVHKAALRETTAAALLQISEWNPKVQSICDPMCGSGTIAIEAAMLAANTAPGLLRYGHSQDDSKASPRAIYWPDSTPSVWDNIWEKANQVDLRKQPNELKSLPRISANDRHRGAIELAVRAAGNAGVHRMIDFSCRDISDYQPKSPADIVVTNPPWDMRLEGAGESWHKLGNFAREHLDGKTVWALSGNSEITRELRLKTSLRVPLSAAAVDLRFLKYEINEYRGSKESSNQF